MKRLLSIFFLLVFLFNVGGYYVVFWGLQYQAELVVQHQLETGTYAASNEVILSIPINLPYPVYEESYSRVHGDFEHDGVQYKLLRQKIVDDKLIIVCVKDEKGTKLDHTLSTVAKAAHSKKTSQAALSLLTKLINEFQREETVPCPMTTGWSRDISHVEINLSFNTTTLPINIPPPRVA